MAYTPFHNTFKKSKALRSKKSWLILLWFIIILFITYTLHTCFPICYIYVYTYIILDQKMTRKKNTFEWLGQVQAKWSGIKGKYISSFSKIRECGATMVTKLPFVNGQVLASEMNALQTWRQTFSLTSCIYILFSKKHNFPWLAYIHTEVLCTDTKHTAAIAKNITLIVDNIP